MRSRMTRGIERLCGHASYWLMAGNDAVAFIRYFTAAEAARTPMGGGCGAHWVTFWRSGRIDRHERLSEARDNALKYDPTVAPRRPGAAWQYACVDAARLGARALAEARGVARVLAIRWTTGPHAGAWTVSELKPLLGAYDACVEIDRAGCCGALA